MKYLLTDAETHNNGLSENNNKYETRCIRANRIYQKE